VHGKVSAVCQILPLPCVSLYMKESNNTPGDSSRNSERLPALNRHGDMSITKHAESHLDHNLSEKQLAFVLSQTPTGEGVAVFTVAIPSELGTLPCGLYGPAEGDNAVPDSEVSFAVRGERKGESRVIKAPMRYTSEVTIVAGPHDGHDWVLFTSYGGSAAPREPFEFADDDDSKAAVESREFWATHALAEG